MDPRQEQFTQELLGTQPRLRVYIHAMVGNRPAVDDILQQTNLVLCRKSDQYEPGTNFAGWAMKIAHYEVLKQRQKFARSRLVFDESLAEAMAETASEQLGELDGRRDALRRCLEQLSETNRDLIHRRYTLNESIDTIGESLGRPSGSIRQTLYRVRTRLAECIRGETESGGAP